MDIERMDDFFNKRASGYDEHMKENIKDFNQFYNNIAEGFENTDDKIKVLDIGCGTGIELEQIFKKAPNAALHCLDLSEEMLKELQDKYQEKEKQITVEIGSYLDNNLGNLDYDYVVSVMTVHHLVYDDKLKLYKNVYNSLKPGGIYIEGDYIVEPSKEKELLDKYNKLDSSIKQNPGNYHIDIPFSLNTQKMILKEAGFKEFKLVYKKDEAAIYSVKK